jgi:transposase
MARRHEPTDAQWASIEPHLPPPGRGRAWADHRRVVGGVCFRAATGTQWRDPPERFGPWQTVSERFRRWRDDGTWLRLLRVLQGTAGELGLIGWSVFGVDSAVARASRAAGGGRTPAPGRAGRPRPRPGAGRARHHAAPGGVRPRPAGRGGSHPRPGG